MVTLLKLGGSLITDKTQREILREDVLARLANEIAQALGANPTMQLVIGHGSGSFGHYEAKEHGTMAGVRTDADWRGFARVATIAATLNYHVANALQDAGVSVMRVQPSASAIATDGVITELSMVGIERALSHKIVPLVYGDVAFDEVRGGTIISTETVLTYITQKLPVERILLLGEVGGVLDDQKAVIPTINSANFDAIAPHLGGSGGVDVTGGMYTKVKDMLSLASNPPYPTVQILNGMVEGRLQKALSGADVLGTMIRN
ncbi:MAG: isopentenyl phosphate kinase [Chloroflexota bacterium]